MGTGRGRRVRGGGARLLAVLAVLLAMTGAVNTPRAAEPAPAPPRRGEAPAVAAATGTPAPAATPIPPIFGERGANGAAPSPVMPLPTPALPVRQAPPALPPPPLPPPPPSSPAPAPTVAVPLAAAALPTPTRAIGPENHPAASRPTAPPVGTPAAVPPTRPVPIPAPNVAPITRPEVLRGMQYATWWHGEYSLPESDATLSEKIAPLGANWIAPIVTCYSDTVTSTTIACGTDRTPTDADLAHVIAAAHARGLKAMLKPHVDLDDPDHWRGEIGQGMNAATRAAWFASYTAFILRYAALAQATNADLFVVGTELSSTSDYEAEWREVVRRVRTLYAGPLTYAANHGEEVGVPWWDAVDYIGIDAYYPLTDHADPTVAELKAAWGQHLPQIAALAQGRGKPVLFTEAGYQSQRGTNITPWNTTSGVLDLQEQANCYIALLEVFRDQPWWRGVFWWEVDVGRTQGGPTNTHFTPINKPAGEVVRAYYGGAGAGPIGTPTATPLPAPPRR